MMTMSLTRSTLSFVAKSKHVTVSKAAQVRPYNIALARHVSPLIARGVVMQNENGDESPTAASPTNLTAAAPAAPLVDYAVACEQHEKYIQTLRSILPTLQLPSLDNHPDCVFIEDAMVALGGTIVFTQPGHPSRRGEAVDAGLRRAAIDQLGASDAADMSERDPGATCDGGDVLFTGRHLYVGLSSRTNEAGWRVLADVFADRGVRVIPVPMPAKQKRALHLKSVVTALDEETLLAPSCTADNRDFDIGREVLSNMLESGGYETILLPNMLACNVVVVNGNVLAQDVDCPVSRERIIQACEERKLQVRWVNTSELAKVDGALTCCSVLLDI